VAEEQIETRDREWPNLFIVGAPKAGTTALWRYLHAHPEIFMSPLKEPRFFSRPDYLPSTGDAETYLGHFSGARGERFRGEATPTYLYPENAPRAIRRVSPEARIVISLREPIDLTHAVYWAYRVFGGERRNFGEATRDEVLEGEDRSDVRSNPYAAAAIYTPPVRRYLDTFGERLFVLFFDDLVADPRAVVRSLFEFLDVDPSPADHFNLSPRNQFGLPRNRLVDRLVKSPRTARVARAIVPRPWRDPIWRAVMPPAEKQEPDPETIDLLQRYFEPDVLALRDLLGRRLPEAWERRFPSAAKSPPRPDRPSRGPAIATRRV
jgi:sulfotransferase family protein